MKILVINLDKGIFSENSASLERLKEYSSLAERIYVIVWTLKHEQPINFADRLFIYPTNSFSRLFYYFDTIKIALRIIKKEKIDLIFTQDPFETGLIGRIISKIKKIPLQLQIHTDFLSPYFWNESLANKIRVLVAKFLVPRAQGLRVVSERIKRSIISNINNVKYPASKISVLPIFVDVKKIQTTPVTVDLHRKYPQFDFIILIASRLSKEKNISLAIRAMCEIVKKHPKAGLLIVGSGPEEEKIKLLILNFQLQDNIKMEPWTNEIYAYFKSADVFLLTSNYEGYGMATVEAMAAGCPVITTDVGAAGEIVKDEISGMIVPVNDHERLVAAINRLISEQPLREKIILGEQKIVATMSSKQDYLAGYKKSWDIIF